VRGNDFDLESQPYAILIAGGPLKGLACKLWVM
jgi:hypothetical protein